MKIDTHNFLGDRFLSIFDINRLINIDYIDWHRLYRLFFFSIDWPHRDISDIWCTILARTMPADSNKAIMFYASKLEQGVATVDKPVEDTGTAKAPLTPIHLVNELGVKILRYWKNPTDWKPKTIPHWSKQNRRTDWKGSWSLQCFQVIEKSQKHRWLF